MCGGLEDGALIKAQHFEPVRRIGDVVFMGFEFEPETRREIGATQLGDELFAG